MYLNKEYIEEMNENSREFQQLDDESTFALCYAMICSQMGF